MPQSYSRHKPIHRPPQASTHAWLFVLLALAAGDIAQGVDLVDDAKGFGGLAWGTALHDRPDMTLVEDGARIQSYERAAAHDGLPLSSTETVRYVAIEKQFARVTIRYQGQARHDAILGYLQQRYGAVDRTPGQMTRGLNQQYNWRGDVTEINMTYDGRTERGYVFIDSRTLAPLFNDTVGE